MRYFLLFFMVVSTMISATEIPLSILIGQFNEKKSTDFVDLMSIGLAVNKQGMMLRKEAAEKLLAAYHDFKKVHPTIPFVIVSATRNYDYQTGIWTRKWKALYPKYKNALKTAKDILRFSSMPGTSRHHWGTDFDITNLNSDYFMQDPQGKILYQWLKDNMPKYGFCQPYNEGRTAGYYKEEWHWSYKPIAQLYSRQYQAFMQKNPQLIIDQLHFRGYQSLPLESLIQQYVFSINEACLN